MAAEEVSVNGESHMKIKDQVSPERASGRGENEEKVVGDKLSNRGKGQTEIGNEEEEEEEEEEKPSKLKEMWGKLGLDAPTLMMMFKYASSLIAIIGC